MKKGLAEHKNDFFHQHRSHWRMIFSSIVIPDIDIKDDSISRKAAAAKNTRRFRSLGKAGLSHLTDNALPRALYPDKRFFTIWQF